MQRPVADAVAISRDGGGRARPPVLDVEADRRELELCAYADGRGHRLAFARGTFADLAMRHGDKAVWKLMDRYGAAVVDVPIDGPIPRDIDTWGDYEGLAASSSA